MAAAPDLAQVRRWLDDRQFESVEQVADATAEFNLRVVYSGMPVHVVRNRPGGPLVVGGQVGLDDDVRSTFRALPEFDVRQLQARVREQLTGGPTLYYFLDDRDRNVPFEDLDRIRVERYLYPDGASQHALMDAVFGVAKQLFYLNDAINTLVENVESRR